MKLPYLPLLMLLISISLFSCTKTNNGTPVNPAVDNTPSWVGTYYGTANGSINRIVISKVDNTTVQMQLQTTYGSLYITFATVQAAKLITTTSLSVDETGTIASFAGTYHFTGSATLNGNSIIFSGQAQSNTYATDIKYYYFTGNK